MELLLRLQTQEDEVVTNQQYDQAFPLLPLPFGDTLHGMGHMHYESCYGTTPRGWSGEGTVIVLGKNSQRLKLSY
jgi:hypothetical protein